MIQKSIISTLPSRPIDFKARFLGQGWKISMNAIPIASEHAYQIFMVVFMIVILIVPSIILMFYRGDRKVADHIARSYVATIIAGFSILVAWKVYESKLDHDLELERQKTGQEFYRRAIQYAFVTLRLSHVETDCGIRQLRFIIDKSICFEAANLAARSGELLPNIDFIFDLPLRGSKSIDQIDNSLQYFMDGDFALRARLPNLIRANIDKYASSKSTDTPNYKFANYILELGIQSRSVSSIYCKLASAIKNTTDWKVFDTMMLDFNNRLAKSKDDLRRSKTSEEESRANALEESSDIINQISEVRPQYSSFDCKNVVESARVALPGGGGNGGGGGGGG